MNKRAISRIVLIILAGLGALAGARLSFTHMTQGDICPMLAFIPACIIVFLGYALVLLAAIFDGKKSKPMFFIGWTPVALLASLGVILELTKGETCPPGAMGVPQCFYSLGMVMLCLVLFLAMKKRTIN
jgi:hypothetical protein